MFYKLKYFKNSVAGICGSDFETTERVELINLNLISSISSLCTYTLPFSGKIIGTYAVLVMNNKDTFYIKKDSFLALIKNIDITPIMVSF